MDKELAKFRIFESLGYFADQDFQQKEWFEGPGHLDPAEIVNYLDDWDFEGWVFQVSNQLHDTTAAACRSFYELLDDLPCDDYHEAFCSKEWIEIRLRAKALLMSLKRELGESKLDL